MVSIRDAGDNQRSFDRVIKSLLCGGIAGCAAKSVIAPFDRVKILFQTANPSFIKYTGSITGVFKAMKAIYHSDGILGLFQGHSATLLRIFPYAAIKFMAYEQYKLLLMPIKSQETTVRRTAAGSLAGVTAVFFSYPLDLIRVRLAFQTRSGKNTSFLHTCRIIYSEPSPFFTLSAFSGLSNFYRGFLPTVYGMIPYAGVSFMTYESLKEWCLTNETIQPFAVEGPGLRASALLACGALSGAAAQTASYPFEVIRRHMQVAGVHHAPAQSSWNVAKEILASRGIRGLFVGLSIGYMKVTPMFAVSFYTYEWMQNIFK